ncbi:leucyl/phenylalanyl-tRNA--protein transferase [Capnocytophaga sp. oral taxon 338]|uniref:leucyl/phenylalanyl-tRNA--protein transferase n=1 Tax=Capnocytophaga sp. oral taxon 338 TaxID=710239 RepID=UPI000202F83C|nr:leucyl/phenylalanyl-tRNA--protein transferase [Capnocytophaga sp. oral taxon 338]EGD34350.1 leucyltransferase [Capnocytophaga sp. oral taxon 338 str. F0234]
MYILTQNLYFPPVEQADKTGILAIGGDLSIPRLILAYKSGVFPWYNEDEPIIWWAPPKRMVVYPEHYKVPKSMRNILNRKLFTVTFNQNFFQVISFCKNIFRKDQQGTWITDEIVTAYTRLHDLGLAHSVEVWQDQQLVGGLYGVDLGNGIFCGESMFSKVSNASKVAFFTLLKWMKERKYLLLDCQIYNDHLANLGSKEIPRTEYMKILLQGNISLRIKKMKLSK